jgi:hypothetical protein
MDDFTSSECVRNYEIKYFTDEPLDDGFLTEIGWGATALLIVGGSLALASLAWFLIGLW